MENAQVYLWQIQIQPRLTICVTYNSLVGDLNAGLSVTGRCPVWKQNNGRKGSSNEEEKVNQKQKVPLSLYRRIACRWIGCDS